VIYAKDNTTGSYKGSKTITSLPQGNYKVTEIQNSAWRYKQDGAVSYRADQQYLGRTSLNSVDPPTFNQTIDATVSNTVFNSYWFSSKDSVTNVFTTTTS